VIVDRQLREFITLSELAKDSTAATSDSNKCAPGAGNSQAKLDFN
jgi:hypothetical protein